MASSFEVRGYVRQSYKSKNFKPGDNPLLQESSSESDGVRGDDSPVDIMLQSTMPQTEKKERPLVTEYRDETEIKEEVEEENVVEFNQR